MCAEWLRPHRVLILKQSRESLSHEANRARVQCFKAKTSFPDQHVLKLRLEAIAKDNGCGEEYKWDYLLMQQSPKLAIALLISFLEPFYLCGLFFYRLFFGIGGGRGCRVGYGLVVAAR